MDILNIEKGCITVEIQKEVFANPKLPVALFDFKNEQGSIHVAYEEDKNVSCEYTHHTLGTTKILVPFFTLPLTMNHKLKFIWDSEIKTLDAFVNDFDIHVHKKIGK